MQYLMFAYIPTCTVGVANAYERVHSGWLRSWAASECLEHIKADDQFTHGISIGPVSSGLSGG